MSWLLSAIAVLLVSLAIRDAWGWLPRLGRACIWVGTAGLPKERRLVRRSEWYAELEGEYDDRRLTGLLWTLTLWPVCAWERATTPIPRPVDIASALGRGLTSLVLAGVASGEYFAVLLLGPERLAIAMGIFECAGFCWLAREVRASRRLRAAEFEDDDERSPRGASLFDTRYPPWR